MHSYCTHLFPPAHPSTIKSSPCPGGPSPFLSSLALDSLSRHQLIADQTILQAVNGSGGGAAGVGVATRLILCRGSLGFLSPCQWETRGEGEVDEPFRASPSHPPPRDPLQPASARWRQVVPRA